MRRYSIQEAADRTGLHRRELVHYVTHFARFFDPSVDAEQRKLSDSELETLTRIHASLGEGMTPTQVETSLLGAARQARTVSDTGVKVVLVASARARAGKSTVAYAVASALSRMTSGVKILDFGTAIPRSSDLADRGSLPATPSSGAAAELADMVEAETGDTRWVLIDTGSGDDELTLRLAPLADLILVIVTEDVAANAGAMSLVRSLYDISANAPVALVINRVTSFQQAADVFTRLNAASVRVSGTELQSLGWIAEDERLRTAAGTGQLTRETVPGLPVWSSADLIASEVMARTSRAANRHPGVSARQVIESLSRSSQASQASVIPPKEGA